MIAPWYVVLIVINILVGVYGTINFTSLVMALFVVLLFSQKEDEIFKWDRDYSKLISVLSFSLFFMIIINGHYASYVLSVLPTKSMPPDWQYNLPEKTGLGEIYLRFEFYFDGLIVAPVSEEIYYRWFLIGKVKPKYRLPAIIISVVLFSMAHVGKNDFDDLNTHLFTQAVYLPHALLFTVIFLRFGLVYAIAAHGLNNLYPLLLRIHPYFKLVLVIFILIGVTIWVKKIFKRSTHNNV